ncbi:phosphotransferase [Ornithinimicrobium faecis]|uniref:Phosphotransferase n=1 Tax=Ornithinimicrobium faecis TaxID=2934158 RepID=A0ABY4YX39_9MICO|nr:MULTISPECIES: phosphotransferase [unclassified Ornithinimicrobium]USQ81337.1 phosphotransferase [Ornithinimicrobium sp. HY1793]
MELLARGRDAEVFGLDEHTVLRRFRGPRDLRWEVAAMEAARDAGLPVPAVHEIRPDAMVLERIHGPTMLEALLADPGSAQAHAVTLAELHLRLGQITAPDGMSTPVGAGESLVHLDLHPGNVILGSAPTIIDWTNAGRGPVSADPATCWLLTRVVQVEAPAAPTAEFTVAVGTFVETFLDCFDLPDLLEQLPAVGRARLHDVNLTPEEQERIRAFLDDPW